MSCITTLESKYFNNMGGCSCKKRKIFMKDSIELLPSKLLFDSTCNGYRSRNDIKDDEKDEHKQSEDKQSTSTKSLLTSSLNDQHQRGKEDYARSQSTSNIKNCCICSPKIIIKQNIIIKQSMFTNDEHRIVIKHKNTVEKQNSSTFKPVTVKNYTKFDIPENYVDGIDLTKIVNSNIIHSEYCEDIFQNKSSLNSVHIYRDTFSNLTNTSEAYNVTSNESCNKRLTILKKKNNCLHSQVSKQDNERDYSQTTFKKTNLAETANCSGEDVAYLLNGKETVSSRNEQEEHEDTNTSASSLSSVLNRACFLDNSNSESTDETFLFCPLNDFSSEYGVSSTYFTLNGLDVLPTEISSIHHRHPNNVLLNQKRITNSHLGSIYNTEYIDDIFHHIRTVETKTVLNNDFLNKYNPDYIIRSKTVNWMLKVQVNLNLCESQFYISVYLLDKVLATIYIPQNMYKLLAITTILLTVKLCGPDNITASTLLDTNQNCYSLEQLFEMEKNVLQLINFEIHSLEPSMCVSYYLKLLNLHNNNFARLSALYALDFLALVPEFSSTPTSLAAAAAISFVQGIFNKSTQIKIYHSFIKMFSTEEIDVIKYLEVLLYVQLKNMTDKRYKFKEPYNKYNVGELLWISKFMDGMV